MTFRAVAALFLVMTVFPPTTNSGPLENDFRLTKWGMHRNDVLAAEEATPKNKTKTHLDYHTVVAGKKVALQYTLAKDRLIGARYLVTEKHIIPNKYVTDYEDFKAVLSRKYGLPQSEKDSWKNGSYFRNDKTQWGFAVSTGKLTRTAAWQTETTEIKLVLKGINFDILCEITYLSRQLKHLALPAGADSPDAPAQDIGNTAIERSIDDF
jgi:hypothetical protein